VCWWRRACWRPRSRPKIKLRAGDGSDVSPLPPGLQTLSKEERDVRTIAGAELNLSSYDRQIYAGQETDAVRGWRNLSLEVLAKARRRKLASIWGPIIEHPEASEIFLAHAKRMARLKRLEFLAEMRKYNNLLPIIEQLMQKQQSILDRRLQRLRDETPPSAKENVTGAEDSEQNAAEDGESGDGVAATQEE